MVVYGTRPEAIKMAPVVHALQASDVLEPLVMVTGQHRQMLDQVNNLFGIDPALDLAMMRDRQTLTGITVRALEGVSDAVERLRPDALVVQGDTTTSFAAALAGFYQKVPVFHVEAGLRTGDRYNPFPEEINRRLTTQLTSLHLAPTPTSRANLLAEGIDPARVLVTGNTVIDALLHVVGRDDIAPPSAVTELKGRLMVLVTSHRRESWGEPMARTAAALARLAGLFPDIVFLLPAHLNPVVRETLLPPLASLDNVVITDPMEYGDFALAMRACHLVLTDSGGVQEEAPSLGKPVLVMRETTERPEAVDAGTVRLVGTDEDLIVDEVTTLLTDPAAYGQMSRAINPYGDGRAAARVAGAIEHFFGIGPEPIEFVPASEGAGSHMRT
ncbi:non-hydrolyzing UDP-N-acetylglucosamine 2-epimerase [Georgenia yuyongxinii]